MIAATTANALLRVRVTNVTTRAEKRSIQTQPAEAKGLKLGKRALGRFATFQAERNIVHTRFEVSSLAEQLALIAIEGEVDIESAPELQGQVEAVLTQGRSIAISFENCSYLDSSVINVLVKAHTSAVAKALRVVVVASAGSGPRRIFDVAGLHHLMPVVDTLEKAKVSGG